MINILYWYAWRYIQLNTVSISLLAIIDYKLMIELKIYFILSDDAINHHIGDYLLDVGRQNPTKRKLLAPWIP